MSTVDPSTLPSFCPACRTIHDGKCSREDIVALFGSLLRRLDNTMNGPPEPPATKTGTEPTK